MYISAHSLLPSLTTLSYIPRTIACQSNLFIHFKFWMQWFTAFSPPFTLISLFLPLPPLFFPVTSSPFPSSILLFSAAAVRGRALHQMTQSATSVLGCPLPPLVLAHLPLTPTHTRPRLKLPLLLGKGWYSCMTVMMQDCSSIRLCRIILTCSS